MPFSIAMLVYQRVNFKQILLSNKWCNLADLADCVRGKLLVPILEVVDNPSDWVNYNQPQFCWFKFPTKTCYVEEPLVHHQVHPITKTHHKNSVEDPVSDTQITLVPSGSSSSIAGCVRICFNSWPNSESLSPHRSRGSRTKTPGA